MNKYHTHVSRRTFLTTAAASGMLASLPSIASGKSSVVTQPNTPHAQDFVVVAKVPDRNKFIHDPAMEILPNGTLVAASPIWACNTPPMGPRINTRWLSPCSTNSACSGPK